MVLTDKEKKSIMSKLNTLNEKNLKKTIKSINDYNSKQLLAKLRDTNIGLHVHQNLGTKKTKKKYSDTDEELGEFSD